MAEYAAGNAESDEVREMAASMATSQRDEIAEMERELAELTRRRDPTDRPRSTRTLPDVMAAVSRARSRWPWSRSQRSCSPPRRRAPPIRA